MKKEMILLGAGASVEAGVPDAINMSKQVANHFREEFGENSKYSNVISFVIGGLLFQEGIRGGDPFHGVNVEELFNAVQLLAERNNLEAAPFVGSWHSFVEDIDKFSAPSLSLNKLIKEIYSSISKEIISALTQSPSMSVSRQIDSTIHGAINKALADSSRGMRHSSSSFLNTGISRAVEDFLSDATKKWINSLKNRSPQSSHSFEREFAKAIDQQKDRPGRGLVFQRTAEQMILALASMVLIRDQEKVAYLQPLLRLLQQQRRLVIATLNYDNSIELLADSNGVHCNKGIGDWSRTGEFSLSGDGLHLLKLHGSIDWVLEPGEVTPERPMPHSVIRQASSQEVSNIYRPAVIFGQKNKLTAEGPFLDLLRSFQKELMSVKLLTVIGYSFRDPHINEFIAQWLNKSNEHFVRVIDPGFGRNDADFAGQLRTSCQSRLIIIPQKTGEALKSLYV